jgi:phosphoribosylaminoimidazole (AIR) synthetase
MAEALLTPTRIYARSLKSLFAERAIKGAAHITGGGLVENTPRALPDHLGAKLDWGGWKRPELFQWLQETGAIPEDDLRRTFNLGVGMALIVAKQDAGSVMAKLVSAGEEAFAIGEVAPA